MMSGLNLAPGRPAPWTCFHRAPCYGGSPEVLSTSNEPEEFPRSPGGDEIVGAPRVAFRIPGPLGRSCYVGQVTPRAKSGSSRICAQRASVK